MAPKATETETATKPEPTMGEVMAILAGILAENSNVQKEQLRQTKKRSNTVGTMRSPYNPRGDKDYPMAPLKCAIHYQFGMTAELHSLDREEVDLMNLIEPGQYTIEMADQQPQVLFVVGRTNDLTGKIDELQFRGPKDEKGNYTGLFTEERKGRFPSTKSILRQILGDKANDVLTMKEEVRRIHLPVSDPLYLPVSLGE